MRILPLALAALVFACAPSTTIDIDDLDLAETGSELERAGEPQGKVPEGLPSKCFRRGQALVSLTLTVTDYKGVQHGRNGEHEIVVGTISHLDFTSDTEVMSDEPVQLAMNIVSAHNPSGLPQEIPLEPGEEFSVQGIYMPSEVAQAKTAILHFTHEPCGFVTLDGETYGQ